MSMKLTVDEFTTPDPLSVNKRESLANMKSIMQEKRIRHLLITDDGGELIGIVSDRDIANVAASKLYGELVAEDIMSANLLTVSPESLLYDVALEMSQNKFGSAIVCDQERKPVGIFTDTDALNALVEILRGDLESSHHDMSETSSAYGL